MGKVLLGLVTFPQKYSHEYTALLVMSCYITLMAPHLHPSYAYFLLHPQLLISTDSLHHLKVASCNIGDDGASSLAKGLARNGSLKTLDLSNNYISDTGAEELGLALKVNKSLKGLILWHNRIFHTGAEGIATGLASNKTLQWLGVS